MEGMKMDDEKRSKETVAMKVADETPYGAKLRHIASRLDREAITKRLRKLGVRIGEARR